MSCSRVLSVMLAIAKSHSLLASPSITVNLRRYVVLLPFEYLSRLWTARSWGLALDTVVDDGPIVISIISGLCIAWLSKNLRHQRTSNPEHAQLLSCGRRSCFGPPCLSPRLSCL